MLRQTILILLFFSIVTTSFSQGNVGSPYSRNGIGDITHCTGVRNLGLGGLGYTLPYNNNISFLNPANTRDIDSLTFIFDIGLNGGVRSYYVKEPIPSKNIKNDFQISHFVFGFPMTKRWKASLGYTPYSKYSYLIQSSDDSFDISKTYKYSGSGGLNRLVLNNSVILYKGLSVGLNVSYLFGKIQDASVLAFDKVPGYINIYERNSTRVNAVLLEFGTQYSHKIDAKNTIMIGGTLNLNNKLGAKRDLLIFNTLSTNSNPVDTITNLTEQRTSIKLPQTTGIGLGYLYNNRVYVGIDYTNVYNKNTVYISKTENLKNSHSLAMGCEYTPGGLNRINYKYSDAVSYRIGAYMHNTHIKTIDGQAPINDFGLSLGVGLPIKRSKSSINISAQLGQRGTDKNGFIKERYAIIGVNFNLNDMWFIKSKID